MHELSICRALLDQVERVATANAADTVTRVAVAIGPLSGVEPALLERAFDIARAGTMAAAARLELERMPIRVRCRACGRAGEGTATRLTCPGCGSARVDLISGDQLCLLAIDVATGAPAATGRRSPALATG